MVRVERPGAESEPLGAEPEDGGLLLGSQVMVIGEQERGRQGERHLTDVRPVLVKVDQLIRERLKKRGKAEGFHVNPWAALALRRGAKSLAQQSGGAPLVRVEASQLAAHQSERPGGTRRTEEDEEELGIPPQVMGEQEGGIHAAKQDVQASRRPCQVVEAEVTCRGRIVSYDDETSANPGRVRLT